MNALLHYIRMVAAALITVFVAAVLAELPPMAAAAAWIQEREWPLVLATGSVGVIGFVLMMGGILHLLMEQDQPLSHADVEDVERSVRMAARPVTWRASAYRVWGSAGGRGGSEEFSFQEAKQAWKSGAVWYDRVWKRRLVTGIGAMMLAVGLLGSFVVLGPGWAKVLFGGALLYATTRISWGLWRA